MEKEINIPLQHVQNYMRLQNLLNYHALPLLRKLFVNNWKTKYQREWINSETQATEFISDIGAILFKDARKIQKNLLKTGDLQKWDVPLMIDALKCFHKPTSKIESKICLKDQLKSFNHLIEVRNRLSHHGGLEIDNESFEKMWNSTSAANHFGNHAGYFGQSKNCVCTGEQREYRKSREIEGRGKFAY